MREHTPQLLGMVEYSAGQCVECQTALPWETECFDCERCDRLWCVACLSTPEGLFPTRFEGRDGLEAREGDCRLPFTCPVCNLRKMGLKIEELNSEREVLNYYMMGMCDKQVTIDTFSKEAKSTSKGYLGVLKRVLRWQKETGVQVIGKNRTDLSSMCDDARGLKLFVVDQTCAVKFGTARKPRSAITNLYSKWGVKDIPTNSQSFTWFANGLAQRIGIEVNQAEVFPDQCLVDMDRAWEQAYRSLRGEKRLQTTLAALAWHIMLGAGLRANEPFNEKIVRFRKARVGRKTALERKVPPHLRVWVGLQTKEERFRHTEVLCAYETSPGMARIRPGVWAERALKLLDRAGVGHLADRYLFSVGDNAKWNMSYMWAKHVSPQLEALQRQRQGDLGGACLDDFGGNSFRRTWASLAARGPRKVSRDLMERQGRWRKKMRRKQQLSMPMTSLYVAPIIRELLKASTDLG